MGCGVWRSRDREHREARGCGHGWGLQGVSPWWGILKHLSPQRLWFPEAPGCMGLISVAAVPLTWHLAQISAQNLGPWTPCLVQSYTELLPCPEVPCWLLGMRDGKTSPSLAMLLAGEAASRKCEHPECPARHGGLLDPGAGGRSFKGGCSLEELILEQNLQEEEELASRERRERRERKEPEGWPTSIWEMTPKSMEYGGGFPGLGALVLSPLAFLLCAGPRREQGSSQILCLSWGQACGSPSPPSCPTPIRGSGTTWNSDPVIPSPSWFPPQRVAAEFPGCWVGPRPLACAAV